MRQCAQNFLETPQIRAVYTNSENSTKRALKFGQKTKPTKSKWSYKPKIPVDSTYLTFLLGCPTEFHFRSLKFNLLGFLILLDPSKY